MKNRGFEVISTVNKEDVFLPKRATKASAGYDLSSIEEVVIAPKTLAFIKTGLKAYMLEDEVLELYARSSLATKRRLVLMNSVGIIDSDYYNNPKNEGHILIALYNHSNEEQVIGKGERIAQGIFKKYLKTDDDTAVEKRRGGFGSSNA